ncbi:hypothetical protein K7X08_031896 [Anisodus acutangulus]|uniref:RING-type E3 ubiquitin transferase n=1 Tax=Anisodus acutangulus TaxID=402998 RepID=A0A9Q1MQY0_9SOLA|nr:hypothetical protein K7X08_031896 [Anisodus acutangulus]
MEEGKISDDILTSAAAFVEGGIQDACDNTCSICLEEFSDSDPSTVTGCKHEFHLQCILECRGFSGNNRSTYQGRGVREALSAPMCWQPLSLKDPNSQELLDAVEHERNIRMNPPRNTTMFHHPTLGDFELQHLPKGRSARPTPEVLVSGQNSAIVSGQPVTQPSSFQADQVPASGSGSNAVVNQLEISSNNRTPPQSSPNNQDRAGPSEFQSFSESIKSRLSAMSMRYKESLTKSSRGWKENFFLS